MTALAWVLFGLALATVLDPAGRAWVARGWCAAIEYVREDAALESGVRVYRASRAVDASKAIPPRSPTAVRPARPFIVSSDVHDPPPSEGPRPTNDYGEKRLPAPNPTKPYTRRM